ncbi:MAG: hypothetical protein M3525_04975 [Acidobacteriota bacterium]|nr:hypothetical protein [Acidobacteriota bacterium]
MRSIEKLTEKLPDADGAKRFYEQMSEEFPFEVKKLSKNEGLLSDVLTLAAHSPLLATTILQNPAYISWLDRQRISAKVRGREELLESLARFALTNSSVETNVLLARFRRRELLRIYLRDIRGLGTIAETTEEISNLADAVLEYALQIARQELDNRYGVPLETDSKERTKTAQFCIVALGKLGSKELNYASDIDLLFIYSNDGATGGQGTRGAAITNREYFVKLAEFITKIVGGNAGEGAAYRVDLRLRPHGRVGAPAISSNEAVNYYRNSAQAWERQVLIRSRTAAGDRKIYRKFFEAVKSNVFSSTETIENALRSVRLSKEKINLEKTSDRGFNVKLGKGGIREIEFIAQALQLAYAGQDKWLRAPHTLISLNRLADRKLLTETDLTELSDAYSFLRCLEHRLQMENGLQIHIVPDAPEKRSLLASRMHLADLPTFNQALQKHTENVSRIFTRIFGQTEHEINRSEIEIARVNENDLTLQRVEQSKKLLPQIVSALKKSNIKIDSDDAAFKTLELLAEISPHFAETLLTNPALIKSLPDTEKDFGETDYKQVFAARIRETNDFAGELSVLRKTWSGFLLEIVVFDAFEKITRAEAKKAQTKLAEASIEAAIFITKRELERRLKVKTEDFSFAVLGLGKLGGGGMDYNSDLDLILIYEEVQSSRFNVQSPKGFDANERNAARQTKEPETLNFEPETFYTRAAEIFVTTLSSLTRDGHLYRVDLRLRPDGKNGAIVSGKNAFLNYLETRASMWEWLAYVKMRGVAGDLPLAETIEGEARRIIHRKAREDEIRDSGFGILRDETRRVRERLEREKSGGGKTGEIDIKFGEGGMLDVYFAMRFLQLRDNVPDAGENRSTVFMLGRLREKNSLSEEDFQNFANGYAFLSELDHNLRLIVGRSTRVPVGNKNALQIITKRMKIASIQELLENLTVHRLNIRASFERILEG